MTSRTRCRILVGIIMLATVFTRRVALFTHRISINTKRWVAGYTIMRSGCVLRSTGFTGLVTRYTVPINKREPRRAGDALVCLRVVTDHTGLVAILLTLGAAGTNPGISAHTCTHGVVVRVGYAVDTLVSSWAGTAMAA